MRSRTVHPKVQCQDDYYDIPYHWELQKNARLLYELRTQLVLDLLGDLSDQIVLDFGCGDARFTADLRSVGVYRSVGVDISERALRFARCLVPEGEFVCLDDDPIPYSDGTFHAVTALDVIEHIADGELDKWMQEIRRVLKPGGSLVISVPSTRKALVSTHFRHYSPDSLCVYLDRYFATQAVKAYFLRPWWLPEFVSRFYDFDGVWRLYRPLIRECEVTKGLYLLAAARKLD
jgi:SAM-dependent methyltransferase